MPTTATTTQSRTEHAHDRLRFAECCNCGRTIAGEPHVTIESSWGERFECCSSGCAHATVADLREQAELCA